MQSIPLLFNARNPRRRDGGVGLGVVVLQPVFVTSLLGPRHMRAALPNAMMPSGERATKRVLLQTKLSANQRGRFAPEKATDLLVGCLHYVMGTGALVPR